jgi:hypothetical protein
MVGDVFIPRRSKMRKYSVRNRAPDEKCLFFFNFCPVLRIAPDKHADIRYLSNEEESGNKKLLSFDSLLRKEKNGLFLM